MGSLAVQQIESETDESESYFFRRLGELCFTAVSPDADAEHARASGCIRSLVVGTNSGWTAFADPSGVYVAETDRLLDATILGDDFTTELLKPTDPAGVCAAFWRQADVISLCLSADENLLAVCSERRVAVYHMHALAGGSTAPLTSWQLPSGAELRQFVWRPEASPDYTAAVVTHCGSLLMGRLGHALQGLPQLLPKPPVRCCCWSPDGDLLALGGSAATITLVDYTSLTTASAAVPCQEAEERECGKVEIDSLAFVGPRALWAAFALYEDDGSEVDASPTAVLQWPEGASPPEKLVAADMPPPLFFLPECCPEGGGPYLHVTGFPAWGAFLGSHAKAQDDHIRFIEVDPDGKRPPRTVEVLGQGAALTIPGGLDYSDNFVTGLGLDASVPGAVPHPNPEKADVPAAPLLLVATSDAVLRFFRFACTSRASEGIIRPRLSLPPTAPAQPAATGRAAVEPEKAAAVGLPDSDSEASQDEASLAPSASGTSASDAQSQLRQPSMGLAESASTVTPAPRLPQTAAERPQAAALQSASAVPRTASDAESQGESPGIWKLGQEEKAAATQLPSDSESEGESAAESAAVSVAKPAHQPGQQAQGNRGAASEERTAGSQVKPAERQEEAGPSKSEGEAVPQIEEPPRPEAHLKDEGEQVAEMEAKFLSSLFATRKLEAELRFHVARWEAGRSDQTLAGLAEAQQRCSSLAGGVEELRGRCDALQGSHGELQVKAKALTLFGSAPVEAAEAVEAPLAAVVARVRQQLAQIRRGVEELRLNLEALERQRLAKTSGDGQVDQPPFRQLYAAVNSQSLVARKQVERLQELGSRMEDLGISREAAFPAERATPPIGSAAQGRRWQRSPLSPALGRLLPGTPRRQVQGLWEGESGARLRQRILALAQQPDGTLLTVTAKGAVPDARSQVSLPVLRPSPLPASTGSTKPRAIPKFDLEQALAEKLPTQPTWAPATKAAVPAPKLGTAAQPPGQPPIPSRAQVAAAQQLQPSKAAQPPVRPNLQAAPAQQLQPSKAAQPPLPSKAQVAAAQQLQPSKAAQPPLPSKAQMAAAQQLKPRQAAQPPLPSKAQQAAAQQLQAPKPAAAQPPLPSKTQVAAAQQLQPPKPAAAQPPVPPKSLVAAAQKLQPKPAGQPPIPSAAQVAQATALAPAQQAAGPIGFAMNAAMTNEPKKKLDFGSQPKQPSSPQTTASKALLGSEAGPGKAATEAGKAAAAEPPSTPAATSGLFSFGAASTGGFAWPGSQAASPFSASSTPATAAAAPATGSLFGATASTAPSLFGSAPQPSPSATSVGAATAASSSALDFGGLGLGSSAAATTAASPFGQLLQRGAASGQSAFGASSTAFGASSAAFGASSAAFGTPSTGFGASTAGFGASTAGFGASTAGFGASTAGFGASTAGFGASTAGFGGFGAPSQPTGGLGAPAASSSGFGGFQSSAQGFGHSSFGSNFGQPSTPGFGQVSTPGFGTPSTPGFGAPASPGFGTPATPGGFGSPAPTSGGGFGAFASQQGGFSAFSGQGGGFGAAASQGGGFGAAATQGGGFGAAASQGSGFGAGGGGFAGAAAQGGFAGGFANPSSGNSNSAMWQMRK